MNTSIARKTNWVLPVIVLSQFAGTSLWFATNAVIRDLQNEFNLKQDALGHITSAIQVGFIAGTLVFAFFTISDRYSPSRVFFASSVAGATTNLGVYLWAYDFGSLFILRVLTGFFLAGIYPVGMKIASDWYEKGLGKALGYLVGALVIGTAFPHLLNHFTHQLPWQYVIIFTSLIAALGGAVVLLTISDGPFRKKNQQLHFSAFFKVFQKKNFRLFAFGYFGHMWELYTFWAFVPVILLTYSEMQNISLNIPLLAFVIIGAGGLSCILGGYVSQKIGSEKTAFLSLLGSAICCLLSPLLFKMPFSLLIPFLVFWGMVVVSDSPQFSALVAQTAPKESTGTALTIVVSIGFAITIASIQFINFLMAYIPTSCLFMFLGIGPALGLIALSTRKKRNIF